MTFNASKSRRAVARPAGDSESHVRQCAMGLSFATSKENLHRKKEDGGRDKKGEGEVRGKMTKKG